MMERRMLNVAAEIVGWVYFTCWTASFYPQVCKNWKRRSVVGFSFDYLALNTIGYFTYSIYTLTVYCDPVIKYYFHEIEKQASQDQDNTVKITDVVFATHGLAISLVQIVQCFIYERGRQRLARLTIAIVSFLLLVLLATTVVAVFSTDSLPKWAWTLNYCGYCKSGISFVKCIPQIFLHFKTKSTKGWPILGVWGDFAGGVCSVVQMLLYCLIDKDNAQLTGNIPKLVLSSESLCFDVVFILQHYILYNNCHSNHAEGSCAKPNTGINSQGQKNYDTFAES